MLLVGDVLVGDLVVETRFGCRLEACRGACCQEGDRGSPLQPGELEAIEALLPSIIDGFPGPQRREVLKRGFALFRHGAPELRCLADGRCVFAAVLEVGGPLTCLLERAYRTRGTPFPKPRFCHLFPLKVRDYPGRTTLDFAPFPDCGPALGNGPSVVEFCRLGLIRAFGEEWYLQLLAAVAERKRRSG